VTGITMNRTETTDLACGLYQHVCITRTVTLLFVVVLCGIASNECQSLTIEACWIASALLWSNGFFKPLH